ncbi:MAG: LacI family DNA-binding transcriptional regulator [Clostridia bacterium]|nr:LacI family DNA-binding transcriptional regulator [Clostridia bacterium]
MKNTIKDVAKAAGVSVSTVSRVLSGSPRISAQTTQRVKEVVKELGYRPNLLARSLVERTSNIIAALLPSSPSTMFSEPFFFDVLRGIGEYAAQEGYHLMLSTGCQAHNEEESLRQLVSSGIVGGVILLTSRIGDKLMEELYDMHFPFVVLGHPGQEDEMAWVDNDNAAVGHAAAQHLIQHGCKRLVYWDYSPSHSVSVLRRKGFEAAIREANLDSSQQAVVEVSWGTCTPDLDQFKLLFESPNPPDGILAGDLMAMSLISLLKEKGLRVPEDVSVVGFNNTPTGRTCQPPLTSVDLSPTALGRRTLELLLEQMHGISTGQSHRYVPFKIVERSSVKK